MRTRALTLAATVLGYTALGELQYQSFRREWDVYGHCTPVEADYTSVSLVLAISFFLASSAYFACAAHRRWPLSTMLYSGTALFLGFVFGKLWYWFRMTRDTACYSIELCTICYDSFSILELAEPLVAAAALSLVGVLIGAVARFIRNLYQRRRSIPPGP